MSTTAANYHRHQSPSPTLISLLLLLCAVSSYASSSTSDAAVCNQNDHDCHVMYEWVTLDYLWPNESMKEEYTKDGRFDPKHCLLSGVKLYKGEVFVTIPRIRYYRGVPAPLNKVVLDPQDKSPKLEPFPNWEIQEQGSDCNNLQMAMSIEIDPITGYLYVIDPGRAGVVGEPESGVPKPLACPPKLVVFDINARTLVRSHELPSSIASKEKNFLNDIVLDRGDQNSKTVRWVYITDALESKLYVIDLETNQTWAFHDPSMDYEDENSTITVNGRQFTLKLPIDGLAMSRDFSYVYYCALGSLKLWRVPTRVLRDPNIKKLSGHLTYVGDKISQTGGMIYATDSLYYGGLSKNAVYKWDIRQDMKSQGVAEGEVKIESESQVAKDDVKLVWPDAFAIDEEGYMYFSACRANLFLKDGMDFSGGKGPNYRIWKIRIDELGYLSPPSTSDENNNGGHVSGYGFLGYLALLLTLPLSKLIHWMATGEQGR